MGDFLYEKINKELKVTIFKPCKDIGTVEGYTSALNYAEAYLEEEGLKLIASHKKWKSNNKSHKIVAYRNRNGKWDKVGYNYASSFIKAMNASLSNYAKNTNKLVRYKRNEIHHWIIGKSFWDLEEFFAALLIVANIIAHFGVGGILMLITHIVNIYNPFIFDYQEGLIYWKLMYPLGAMIYFFLYAYRISKYYLQHAEVTRLQFEMSLKEVQRKRLDVVDIKNVNVNAGNLSITNTTQIVQGVNNVVAGGNINLSGKDIYQMEAEEEVEKIVKSKAKRGSL